MDVISSKYRKPKGRMSKKRALMSEKVRLRWNKQNEAGEDVVELCTSQLDSTPDPLDLLSPPTSSETHNPEFASDSSHVTRSEKKLAYFNDSNCLPEGEDGYLLVHFSVWDKLFENLSCSYCSEKCLKTNISEHQGWAAKLSVMCSKCNNLHVETYSSPRIKNAESQRPPFEVNNKSVDAFINIGGGHRMMEKISMSMQMHCMDSKTFTKHQSMFFSEIEDMKNEITKKSMHVVKNAHINTNPSLSDNDIIDIAVSYDGTWHKRGHTSLYGIGVVIDILTGLVIDYEILSKYCSMCTYTLCELGAHSLEFDIWYRGHKNSGDCLKNYDGSSTGMEVFAADILWKRSITKCGMRYTTVLSDGDAKTYQHLVNEAVYGDTKILKEECVNHVAKRMGTGLRNMVQEWKKKGVTLGGRGAGTLKETNIVKLTNYYRQAIVKNIPDVHKMKTAILATISHYSSTDSKPLHNKCPSGKETWCFYNKSIAMKENPPSHTNMPIQLSLSVLEKLIPVYRRLANPELLSRCARGATQNANESLHSAIWKKCPKETFISKKRMEIAVCKAVAEYNMGCSATEDLKQQASQNSISPATLKLAARRDKRRLYDSMRSTSAATRTARKKLKLTKLKAESAQKKKEGQTYGAGHF